MLRALLVTLALAQAVPAAADEGELLVAGSAGPDVAWVRHPLLIDSGGAFDALAPTAAMPRARVEAHYCLTNDIEFGLGIDVGGGPNVTTHGELDGVARSIVSGGYVDIGVPLIAAWRFGAGFPVTVLAAFDIAPSITLWSGNALVDESVLDKQHRPQRLPVDLHDVWQPGVDATVRLLVEWRVGDAFGVAAGPYVGAGWSGAGDVHAGVVVQGSWIVPPLWH